jgi:hypothetical protein
MFNFVCKLAPVAHQFQISFFGCQVLSFLRRHVTFDSFDPKAFRSCRHPRQREEIFDVPVDGTRPQPNFIGFSSALPNPLKSLCCQWWSVGGQRPSVGSCGAIQAYGGGVTTHRERLDNVSGRPARARLCFPGFCVGHRLKC